MKFIFFHQFYSTNCQRTIEFQSRIILPQGIHFLGVDRWLRTWFFHFLILSAWFDSIVGFDNSIYGSIHSCIHSHIQTNKVISSPSVIRYHRWLLFSLSSQFLLSSNIQQVPFPSNQLILFIYGEKSRNESKFNLGFYLFVWLKVTHSQLRINL
jgi:hypothetical protein